MAEADCDLCRLMGYRACDLCGNPVHDPSAFRRDLCEYCRAPAVAWSSSRLRLAQGPSARAHGASAPSTRGGPSPTFRPMTR